MDSDPRAHSNTSAFPRLPRPTEQRARTHQGDSDVARATRYQFSSVVCGPPGPWGLTRTSPIAGYRTLLELLRGLLAEVPL